MGCQIIDNDQSGFAAAIELAQSADIVFFFAGINQTVEKEGHDRTSLALPDIQMSLLQQLEKVVHSPIHVVVMSGSSLDLSYAWSNDSTSVSYSIQSLVKTHSDRRKFQMQIFRVNVTNTGSMNGDDIVLGYITPPQVLRDGQTPPIKQLFGFERIHLVVNETKQVFFPFNVESLFTVARDGSKWLHPGQYHILIRGQRMFTVELRGQSALWKRFR